MREAERETRDERVLILTPTGRDADLTGRCLAGAGLAAVVCAGMEGLCEEFGKGAGAAVIAEEALSPEAVRGLLDALAGQPAWSDFPLVVLTGDESAPVHPGTLQTLSEAGNVTLVERPTRVITLLSAVSSALRARRRQYEVRAHLAEEQRAREERARLLEEAVAARAEAEAVNRAKDVFLATLSHELRTPLTAVLGWSRLLRQMKIEDASARHAVDVVERNAEAQYQLIRDLLDVSRIITGKLRLEARQLSLAPVIRAAVDSVRQATEAKAIRLEVEFGDGSDLVKGDPDRLQQVVWNLLSNAIKFTPKRGRVVVRVGRDCSDLRITVSDTGQGIAPEFLPHVFERFRQADGRISREQGGLGRGLSLVRHLVELHGGTIRAASEGEGRGATFTVRLPVAAVSAPGDAAHAAATPEGALSLDGLRVLVVDDQPDARDLIAEVLRRAGAEVSTAGDAAAALQLLGRVEIDVLLSDIGMPGEDGYALIGRVRELAAASGRGRLPAVALTAYASEDDRRRSLAAGFDAHLTKPVEPAELTSLIKQVRGAA